MLVLKHFRDATIQSSFILGGDSDVCLVKPIKGKHFMDAPKVFTSGTLLLLAVLALRIFTAQNFTRDQRAHINKMAAIFYTA